MIYTSLRWLRRALLSDWQHVGILIQNYNDNDRQPKPHYFHLFENQYGDRRYELVRPKGEYWVPLKENISRNRPQVPEEIILGGTIYQTKVYPWLHGAKVEEIPAYNKVRKNWFVRKLQGKDPIVLNEETT